MRLSLYCRSSGTSSVNPGAYARKVLVNRHRSLLRRALVEARYLYRDRPNEGYSDEHHEDAIVLWAATRRLPLRRRARRGRVVAAATGLALLAVLGAAVLVARQLPQDREPAAPAANAAELANRAATAAAAQSIPTSRPHQWVYTKEL